ncbi:MAG: aminotransferase class I/II-fold pyridoxal phosphate-dependent enzyme [Candidatus Eisenbacteria sp.]|nr:aminotransferase class I/II-fold pyridoxal phosphate-dependent enzyme [Candidatus Eisenbacteria bacterium]
MTRALHAEGHHKPFNAHNMPIFQTSTFYFDSPEHGADLFSGKQQGHIYTRIGNPTVEAYERVVSSLEGGDEAVAFSSGLAVIYASIMSFAEQGDHVISGDTLYGPSIHLIGDVMARSGIESTFIDTSDLEAVKRSIRPNTKVVFLETPANPTCRITDIRAVSELAHANGAIGVVDGTFATPRFQLPLELGADISLHSTTKFINGHGDIVGGIATASEDRAKVIRKFRTDTGACVSPMDAFLSLRGVRTLGIRMERQNANALVIAKFLGSHPKVSRVYYHGLPNDPGYGVAMKQMSGFGCTFSFDMAGGYDAAKDLLKGVEIMTLAVSLGTVDTLIQHPASMTHASVPPEIMKQQGLTPEMVRIHVGLEEPEDIIAELSKAFEAV